MSDASDRSIKYKAAVAESQPLELKASPANNEERNSQQEKSAALAELKNKTNTQAAFNVDQLEEPSVVLERRHFVPQNPTSSIIRSTGETFAIFYLCALIGAGLLITATVSSGMSGAWSLIPAFFLMLLPALPFLPALRRRHTLASANQVTMSREQVVFRDHGPVMHCTVSVVFFIIFPCISLGILLAPKSPLSYFFATLLITLAAIVWFIRSNEPPLSQPTTRGNWLQREVRHLKRMFFEVPARIYDWKDLVAITFEQKSATLLQRLSCQQPTDALCLHFASHTFEFSWQSLNNALRQRLFLVISRYADCERIAPQVLFLQMQTLAGNQDATPASFTQVWLDEYKSKFELTNRLTLEPGAIAGNRFRVLAPLSVRGPIATYLVADRSGRRAVLKEIVVSQSSNEDTAKLKLVEQFDREASILCKLDHEQIVRMQDHFIENGRNYIVMDFVSGMNLRQFVTTHGALCEGTVISVARQLAQILQYVHEQQPPIIHRDVSPDNIMFDSETGRITLLDFGAANLFVTKATGTLIGKQCYMPPEQFRGKSEPASDVYGFGATLFFLLTAHDPKPLSGFDLEGCSRLGEHLYFVLKAAGELDPTNRPGWACILTELDQAANAPDVMRSDCTS